MLVLQDLGIDAEHVSGAFGCVHHTPRLTLARRAEEHTGHVREHAAQSRFALVQSLFGETPVCDVEHDAAAPRRPAALVEQRLSLDVRPAERPVGVADAHVDRVRLTEPRACFRCTQDRPILLAQQTFERDPAWTDELRSRVAGERLDVVAQEVEAHLARFVLAGHHRVKRARHALHDAQEALLALVQRMCLA